MRPRTYPPLGHIASTQIEISMAEGDECKLLLHDPLLHTSRNSAAALNVAFSMVEDDIWLLHGLKRTSAVHLLGC